MKQTKKIISVFLAILMIACCVPFASYAQDGATQETKFISDLNVGDTFTYGVYPQTRVTDEATLEILNADQYKWTSFGYYYSSKPRDNFMDYVDTELDGVKYRGVSITLNRPHKTDLSFGEGKSYQDDNGYFAGETYWFTFEPIEWKVLNPQSGLAVTNAVIDAQEVNHTADVEKLDYAKTSINGWLNSEFSDSAFTQAQTQRIAAKAVGDNESAKVFLLSADEAKSSKNGLGSNQSRQAYSTDYAKCMGLEVTQSGASNWWLCTSGSGSNFTAYTVSDGSVNTNGNFINYNYGVRPAVILREKADLNDTELCAHLYCTEPSNAREATCEQSGYTGGRTCLSCGERISGEIIEMLPHTPGETVLENVTPSTCVQRGVGDEVVYCTVCQKELSRKTVKLGLVNHNYVLVSNTATCQSAGVKTVKCTMCNDEITTEVEALHHQYEAIETVEATCQVIGYTLYKCVNCAESYQGDKVKIGHVFEAVKTIPATCQSIGYTQYKCVFCEKSYDGDKQPIKPHEAKNSEITLQPTCTQDGTETTYCRFCGDVMSEVTIEATGHDYSETVVSATCTEQGYTLLVCSVCGDNVKTYFVAPLGHSEVIVPGAEATCTGSGLTDGIACSTCGKTLKPQEYIAKIAHADANADGICDGCGADYKIVTCKCNCHSDGFSGFIWKIQLFFYRIFRVQKVCACGVTHY